MRHLAAPCPPPWTRDSWGSQGWFRGGAGWGWGCQGPAREGVSGEAQTREQDPHPQTRFPDRLSGWRSFRSKEGGVAHLRGKRPSCRFSWAPRPRWGPLVTDAGQGQQAGP